MTKYRILIADDDPEILKQLVKILTDESYQVFSCVDGELVCDLAKEKVPDLILLDWVMPKKNGIEALSDLKKETTTYEIPVIMLTAQSLPDNLEYALDLGAIDYIKKPFYSVELLSRIKRHIKQQKIVEEMQQLKTSQLYALNQNLHHQLSQTSSKLEQELSKQIFDSELLEHFQNKLNELELIEAKFHTVFQELKEKFQNHIHTQTKEAKELKTTGSKAFQNYLKQKIPELTESELRIASLIILNFTNSDIAEALFVSVRTVENHRYHMSKKVVLAKGLSLKEYLQHEEKKFMNTL